MLHGIMFSLFFPPPPQLPLPSRNMNQDKAAKYAFKCLDISLFDSINDAIKIIYIILHPTNITFIPNIYSTLLCWPRAL